MAFHVLHGARPMRARFWLEVALGSLSGALFLARSCGRTGSNSSSAPTRTPGAVRSNG